MNRREFGIALGAFGLGMVASALLLLLNKTPKALPAPEGLRLKRSHFTQSNCPACGHFWLRDYPGYPDPPDSCPACTYVVPDPLRYQRGDKIILTQTPTGPSPFYKVYRDRPSHVTLKIKRTPDERLPRALPPTWTVKGAV